MLTLTLQIGRHGVVLDMYVGVSTQFQTALRSRKRAIPHPVSVSALLDTGADCTLLDDSIAISQLHILPKNRTFIRCLDAPETEEERPAYDVDVFFASGKAQSTKFTLQVAGHTFPEDLPYKAIIGRDLLGFSAFYYDGPAQEIRFSI